MISARQNFRYLVEKQLGGTGLTAETRLADALLARRCRNMFFSAMAPVVVKAACPADVIVQAQTKRFGVPTIITDMLNFDEPYHAGFFPGVCWQLMRIFTSGVGYQEDFFGAGNFLNSMYMLGHYQSNGAANFDAPSVKQHFTPHLMPPGQIFQANWELLDFASVPGLSTQFNPEIDFRAVQVLDEVDPYGQLCGRLKDQVCGYVNRYDCETFILDLLITTAKFPAAGVTTAFSTPPQERPLMIYGIGTNINGAQVTFRDPAAQWEFCIAPTPPTLTVNAGALVAGAYPPLRGIPINVVAGNGDLTMHESYNMLPVPHLLAPNTSLIFFLTNGLRPDGLTSTFTQTMDTNNNELTSTGDGHIALLCRTV